MRWHLSSIFFLLAVLTLLPLGSLPVQAQEDCQFGEAEAPLPGLSGCIDKLKLSKVVNQLANFAVAAIVAIALITVVAAGYVYMTAGGNATQVTTAKTMIIAALLGLALALLSYIILNTINPDLLDLKEPEFKKPNL
jgi:lysylphosphatidylglycerol synthetase-like protein (DUF2156 family)